MVKVLNHEWILSNIEIIIELCAEQALSLHRVTTTHLLEQESVAGHT
jgi:hypothetical protein